MTDWTKADGPRRSLIEWLSSMHAERPRATRSSTRFSVDLSRAI